VTCGANGSVIVTADEALEVPAQPVEVVDTTGCGDAFAAGFIRGRTLDLDLRAAAELGTACAALVAQGLGSDAGDFELSSALRSHRTKT
jgi:sugar/nucleoside kinase (ribokinase family)